MGRGSGLREGGSGPPSSGDPLLPLASQGGGARGPPPQCHSKVLPRVSQQGLLPGLALTVSCAGAAAGSPLERGASWKNRACEHRQRKFQGRSCRLVLDGAGYFGPGPALAPLWPCPSTPASLFPSKEKKTALSIEKPEGAAESRRRESGGCQRGTELPAWSSLGCSRLQRAGSAPQPLTATFGCPQ